MLSPSERERLQEIREQWSQWKSQGIDPHPDSEFLLTLAERLDAEGKTDASE